MPSYFSTIEVARMCDVSRGTVFRWIREGKLSAALTAGGHHKILDRDLVVFLKGLRMAIPPELQDAQAQEHGSTVLVIDDDEHVRRMIKRLFSRRFPGVQVEEAKDGFEAGMMISKLRPMLVILDLMLPGVDGFRVCKMIRESDQLRGIKIIAITGVENPDFENRIRELGADDFLRKPLDFELFRQRVAPLMGGAVGNQSKGAA